MANTMQKYLDRSLEVLSKFGLIPSPAEEDSQLADLLGDVTYVDEPKVLAIAKTLKYTSAFNQLVRDNVSDMKIADRYKDITAMFDSIREDSKKLLVQIDDGKIDFGEKVQNWWMKLVRGTPHKRFEKITGVYKDVSKDTSEHLDKEENILDAYTDYRLAVMDAAALAEEVLKTQERNLAKLNDTYQKAKQTAESYSGEDKSEKIRLEKSVDEADRERIKGDKHYQLIKDVAENLKVGYNVGETLIAKLNQTHELKDRVHKRSITFFATNETVFTTLDAVYASQFGLNEATQTLEAMQEGANKGIEDVTELGNRLEKAALKAGYGSTLNPASVQKLVDSIVAYQTESHQMITQFREEATKNAAEIERIVDEGKSKVRAAIDIQMS